MSESRMASRSLQNLPRLWRTMRHLKPSQLAWRVRYLAQRRLESQTWFRLSDRMAHRLDHSPSEPPRPHFLSPAVPELPAIDRLAELRQGCLTLLNEQRPFAGGKDWRLADPDRGHRLWNFSLHYHSWLRDVAANFAITHDQDHLQELRHWLVDWMDCCPLGVRGFAEIPWNSFNIGQRLFHWREIDALVPRSFWKDSELPRERFLQSIALQAEYLSRHIEWDLRGNHLFKDAVGLATAAEMIGGAAASRWRSQATRLVQSQLREQILADGMHFERSPMYHIHVLEDLLALEPLLRDEAVREELRDACRRMAEPLRWLRHPCGRFPLFNDAAEGNVASPEEVLAELADFGLCPTTEVPQGFHHFANAGLVAWHGEPWTVFFDGGAIGPAYQPGHAHADSLTLEASFAGVPLIVDPGTYCYDHDSHRRYDRSTKAHNTVCIDDDDSSEVWHIFRVGRRANPRKVSCAVRDDGFTAAASHDGYDHLPGAPRHRRQITLTEGLLEISEEITGEGLHRVEGGFLLSPEWTVQANSSGWILRKGSTRLQVEAHPNQTVELDVLDRPWHPEFGKEIMTKRLVWSGNVTLPFRLTTAWSPTQATMFSRSAAQFPNFYAEGVVTHSEGLPAAGYPGKDERR